MILIYHIYFKEHPNLHTFLVYLELFATGTTAEERILELPTSLAIPGELLPWTTKNTNYTNTQIPNNKNKKIAALHFEVLFQISYVKMTS